MSKLITCSHVDFGYENHDAVIDLNMEAESGDYLCIVGENGSGKSTLIKGLLGLLKPTAKEDRDWLPASADHVSKRFSCHSV